MGFGSFLKKAAPVVSTGGLSLLASKGGKDLLFGKKDMGTRDRKYFFDPEARRTATEAGKIQRQALGSYMRQAREIDKMSPELLAKQRLGSMQKQMRGAGRDARMRARDLVAQRGMGRSAAGLGAIIASDRGVDERVRNLRSQLPSLTDQIRQQKLGRLNAISGGVGNIMSRAGENSVFMPGRQATGRRSGGLANLALAAGGAYMGGMAGGPQGAMGGMQMGQGFGSMLGGLA